VIGQARADGLADSTVRHLLTVVKLVLAQGVRWGLLGANPAEGIQTRAPEPRVLPIDDPAQVSAFLDEARADPEGLPVLLAVGLGLRSGEVRGLRWRDVDLDASVIRIRQQAHTTRGEVHFAPLKTARSRRDLPIPGFIASALRDQKRAQNLRRLKAPRWEDHDLVVDGVAGRPIAVLTLLKRVRRICDRALVPHLTFHDLRHLCATILLMEGVSPKVAQAILGHATVNMTMNVYSHVNRALLDDAASSMDRAADRLRKGRTG
jgi:integrase